MKSVWRILQWFLVAWGLACLFAAVALGGFVLYCVGMRNVARVDSADKEDVAFVLTSCALGHRQIKDVVHSYQSARSLTGDHLDAYAVRVSRLDPADLTGGLTEEMFESGWFRCDQVDGVLRDAIDFAIAFSHRNAISWFPREEELRSDEMYVYPVSIHCRGTRPRAVVLAFLRPRDKMIYYMSAKV